LLFKKFLIFFDLFNLKKIFINFPKKKKKKKKKKLKYI